jgi:hypothetical protein
LGKSLGVKAAVAESSEVILNDNHTVVTAITERNTAATYCDRCNKDLAFLYIKVELIRPTIQIIKLLASGKAKRWQGYVARVGFGITRIRNQKSDNSPVMGNSHINHRFLLLCLRLLPDLGQSGKELSGLLFFWFLWETDEMDFVFLNNIIHLQILVFYAFKCVIIFRFIILFSNRINKNGV